MLLAFELMALTRVVGERFLPIVCVLISAVVFLRHFELPYQGILPEFRGGAGAAPTVVLKPTDYYSVGKRVDGNENADFEEKGDLLEFADYHSSNEMRAPNLVEGMKRNEGAVLMIGEEVDGNSGSHSIEEEDEKSKYLALLTRRRSNEPGKRIGESEDTGSVPNVAGEYCTDSSEKSSYADVNMSLIGRSGQSPVSSNEGKRGLGDMRRVGGVSTVGKISSSKRMTRKQVSISEMNSIFSRTVVSSNIMRPKERLSVRDGELLAAKLLIENAPISTKVFGLESSVFRNISMFKRSYELMEKVLKVYVYKEGDKPIFHQPRQRGIYASEGWFMKLMEGNKQFVARDPRSAHLFYLPFSSQMLRYSLDNQNLRSIKDLGRFLGNYIDLIAGKYRFWNRTGGADHFLVACHDWATRITGQQRMRNCIRSLSNANVARGFEIGKDTTLPVTYIKSAEDPVGGLGGKPPTERHILAFFAGGMHGYLRPILLHLWENKAPDMKILGPMPRDVEGKRMYREYMQSSKYCICARGYEVHTPRVVEAIFYECVPVIISDNYVPPFFEVLDWESFAVFVNEDDIPNLRGILSAIPEEDYRKMQKRVKTLQQHFMWHKKPVKYDLFHMILHTVWHNRILQLKPR